MAEIVPVLDLMGGVVVRAVSGRRDEYRPVVSRLTDSCDPLAVADAMLRATGAAELYVADLDAILDRGANTAIVAELGARCGVRIFADCGWRDSGDDGRLPAHAGVVQVFGSETVRGGVVRSPTFREPTVREVHSPDLPDGRLSDGRSDSACAFSVDLRAGELIGRWADWSAAGVTHSRAVAAMAAAGVAATGAATVLLIDLARVGTAVGPGLTDCRAVREVLPSGVRLLVGGGIRDRDDIRRLEDAGADGVLVASALHDGRFS